MKKIVFLDTEVGSNNKKVLDIGAISNDFAKFHSNSSKEFESFLKDSDYICGHNILKHDFNYIKEILFSLNIKSYSKVIDTLYLSPLMFPKNPYHRLLKDDKMCFDEKNNPLNDAIKAKELFDDEVSSFELLDTELKDIYYFLLHDKKEFKAFFKFIEYAPNISYDIQKLIRNRFNGQFCENTNLKDIIKNKSIELAYALALISVKDRSSFMQPWVLNNYPDVQEVINALRGVPCDQGCEYCNIALNIYSSLKKFFNYSGFRSYGGESLQENAVKEAVNGNSLLAIFPTGGGKSLTFQLPALISAQTEKGLTVVISPLQSLMKDQVDGLRKKGITDAVTINSILDPIERKKAIEYIESGAANILYISPESLRSRTIENLLLKRNVVRFVIDEAHCFSSWGQDFRVDYLYIGDFIKKYQEKKHLKKVIPVSCFTATAKKKVISDICDYFKDKLSLELKVFKSAVARENLKYKVYECKDEEEKFKKVMSLLDEKKCPTIIYVSRTKRAEKVSNNLLKYGYHSIFYHGRMDKKERIDAQNKFMKGDVDVIVATSAFGMGVDKDDVERVIHFEISDSLENYVQEAGRAGRDPKMNANCYILFNEEDLDKHFLLHNQTKLSIKEIKQVWKAIKELTKFRSNITQSALEIANKAGWDDTVNDMENRIKTAISALEEAKYLKREQNVPRIYATSLLPKNMEEARKKLDLSNKFNSEEKKHAILVLSTLYSYKNNNYVGESRVDYLSDILAIEKRKIIRAVNLLVEEEILADKIEMGAHIDKKAKLNKIKIKLDKNKNLEILLLSLLNKEEKSFNLKNIVQEYEDTYGKSISVSSVKTILNFWSNKKYIKKSPFLNYNFDATLLNNKKPFKDIIDKRIYLASFIIEYLYEKAFKKDNLKENEGENFVQFTLMELISEFEYKNRLTNDKASIKDVEDALFYLSRIKTFKIDGNFMVLYNAWKIKRIENDNNIQYKKDDYKRLEDFYKTKVEQIHIVGEFAKKMINDYKGALLFVNDYFNMDKNKFIRKYFKKEKAIDLQRNITTKKFKELFGQLSPNQLKIVKDQDSKYIIAVAGPGSGKTKVIVHKLASLYSMEDVKHEQLLMLTFSRASAVEFKQRLIKLIGNAAHFVEIKTFHAYCFDLLGKIGSIEKSQNVIKEAVDRIKEGDIDFSKITKTVLVIDEAQDMDENIFQLIQALMERNEEMKIIAVGDDDQNIYKFRGSDSKYMGQLASLKEANKVELLYNFRSRDNLVKFSNKFAKNIRDRLKQNEVLADNLENGEINITSYTSNNIIMPLIQDVINKDLMGTTGILTTTNEEALKIYHTLKKNNLKVKLIQTNDNFNLYDLYEVRALLNKLNIDGPGFIIDEEKWSNAKEYIENVFQSKKTKNYEILINIMSKFESISRKKYKNDFVSFIKESRLEDFYSKNDVQYIVSTIHKSKGQEYDNVFLLLQNFSIKTEEQKRQLYVAISRAKNNLNIHYKGDYFKNIRVEGLNYLYDNNNYSDLDELSIQLNHEDIYLDKFKYFQSNINKIRSGDRLLLDNQYCLNEEGKKIIQFSKKFLDHIDDLKKKSYFIKKISTRFIVYWKKKGEDKEVKIVLPEIVFCKK